MAPEAKESEIEPSPAELERVGRLILAALKAESSHILIMEGEAGEETIIDGRARMDRVAWRLLHDLGLAGKAA